MLTPRFLLLSVFILSACSSLQLGREFDQQGNEIEPHGSRQPGGYLSSEVNEGNPASYGDAEPLDILGSYQGGIGQVSVEILGDMPAPFSNTRDQRLPNGWGLVAAQEAQRAESRVLKVLSHTDEGGDGLAKRLQVTLKAELEQQLTEAQSHQQSQRLSVRVSAWGLSDQFGIYSANLRAVVKVVAALHADDSSTTLWQGELSVRANESDRPMAPIDELEDSALLLGQHVDVASQFLAHRVVTAITGKPYSQPRAYEASRWIDGDED